MSSAIRFVAHVCDKHKSYVPTWSVCGPRLDDETEEEVVYRCKFKPEEYSSEFCGAPAPNRFYLDHDTRLSDD